MADNTPVIPSSVYSRQSQRVTKASLEQQQREREQQIEQEQAAARALLQQQMEEQGNETIWQKIGSLVGGAASGAAGLVGKAADAVVPNDSRSVPVLGQAAAVGSAVVDNAVKPAGKWALNAYDETAKDISLALATGANAANPKYWQNRDPESDLFTDSVGVQPGRAGIAAIDGLTSYLGPLSEPLIGGDNSDAGISGIYSNDPDFDISDKAQRDKMFDDNLSLRLASGTVDALATWFLDPGVIAGKGVTVARRGTTMFGKSFAGYTARTTIDRSGRLNEATMTQLQRELDQATEFVAGSAPKDSAMGVVADSIVRGDYEELLKLKQFQGPNRDQAAAIGSLITDKTDAINFLGASYGIKKYQDELARSANDLWVSMVRSVKGSPYETATLNTPAGAARPAVLPDLLEDRATARAVLRDAAKRDPELADALKRSDALGAADMQISEMGQGFLDYVGGSSAQGMRIAQAWRDGRRARATLFASDRAASTRAGAEGSKRLKASYEKPNGTAPAVYERVFQASSAMPRIRLWDWVGGQVANGHINIRDFNDGKAADELMAALTDSSTVKKNKDFMKQQLSIFASAGASTDLKMRAIKQIEENVSDLLAREHGANPELLKQLYKRLDKKRSDAIESFKTQGYAIDPDDGSIIRAGAQMRSQLANSMPMLNMRVMEKSAKIAGRDVYKGIKDADLINIDRQLHGASVKNFFDEVETLWKAGVLIRLGYTQRNVVEGWLRSAAYLGTIPALAKAPEGFINSFYNNTRRVSGKMPTRSADGKMHTKLNSLIILEKKAADSVNELRDRVGQAEQMILRGDPNMPDVELLKLRDRLQAKMDEVTAVQARIDDLKSRKTIGSRGAFSGEYADIIRRLSSSDQTNKEFLESAIMRNRQEILNDKSWRVVSPGDDQYWKELSNAIRQFRADDIAMRLLQGRSVGEVVAHIKSPAGRGYRNDMQLAYSEVEGKVVQLSEIIDNYIPIPTVRRAVARGELSESELQAQLGHLISGKLKKPRKGNLSDEEFAKVMDDYYAKKRWVDEGMTLQPIHGRKVMENTRGKAADRFVNNPVQFMFKVLGTLPETTLVRHPFYAEVWARRSNGLRDLAIRQGKDIDPTTVQGAKVLKQIDAAAHRYAMRATNETLYTIERYSNIANTFRWFSPFIAAWENSFKVWTKLIVNDPSIAARASILWDIPSQLGMIVDKDGNKIEGTRFDFLTGNIDQYVVLPAAMNDFFMKFSGGIPFRVPRSSFNFVTPGATPYLPGFGPVTTFPVGVVLAQKPEIQDILRDNLGDTLYSQIAPFGVPQSDLMDAFGPPWARRMWQWWQGESDQDYLKVVNAITQADMVDWYKNGALPEDKPTPEGSMGKAGNFFLFSAMVSGSAPVSVSRISRFQQEVDAWNALRADPSMTYNQKVEKFLTTYGEEFLPLVVGTSKSEVPGLDPTIEDYKVLQQHGSLARELANLDNSAVGIIASSAPPGVFDEGVYKWLNDQNIPGKTDKFRGTRTPEEQVKAINMSSAWRLYYKSKAVLDAELQRRGLSSLEVKAAADLKESWNEYIDNTMVKQFGTDWTDEFNSYQDRSATYLTAIDIALNNKEFMETTGKSDMWNSVALYMASRQVVIDSIAAGYDRDEVLNSFFNYTADMRSQSIAFSDFYDKFLERDDFREIGLSNLEY